MSRMALLVVLMMSGVAKAQIVVDVSLNADGQALASQLGVSEAELASRIQTQINDAYDTNNVEGFLRSFTDATAFSMRGLGVDYASLPTNLILGVGANFAVAATGEFNAEKRPTSGLSPNVAFMAGLNLSDYGNPRWTLFANGFYRNGRQRACAAASSAPVCTRNIESFCRKRIRVQRRSFAGPVST